MRSISRRGLGLGTLGSTAIGGAPAVARDKAKAQPLHWAFAPVPVVTTAPYHVFGPSVAIPDQEASTISNFKGFVGYASLAGTVTRTNSKTGEQLSFPFGSNTNLRFMTGMFRGTDGHDYSGSFAFI